MGALQLPQYESMPSSPEPGPVRLVPIPRREPARVRPVVTKAQAFRRRRLCVLIVASGLLLGAVIGGKALLAVEASETPPPEPVALVGGEYVVQPGDTYWTIARRLEPEADPRPLVADLRSAHGEAELQVGDRLDLDELAP